MNKVRNLAWLALFLVSACSSSGSSNGGTPNTGDAGSSQEDDGSQGENPVSLPDPGTPPSAVTGIFSFDFMQEGTGEPKLEASAFFLSPPQSMQASPFPDIFSGYQNVPLDQCTALPFVNFSGSQANPLDAGELTVVAPDSSRHSVTRNDFFGMIVYGAELPASAFKPLSEYLLLATGAVVPSFAGSFWTPGTLKVTAPESSGKLNVPRDQPVEVRWEGQGTGEPVLIRLVQQDTTVACRVTDDGEFTIPPSALGFFKPSGSIERDPNEDGDALYVQRLTWYVVGQGSSATLALASTGAQYEVTFQ